MGYRCERGSISHVFISTCNMHLTLDLVVICFEAVFHDYINCLVHT